MRPRVDAVDPGAATRLAQEVERKRRGHVRLESVRPKSVSRFCAQREVCLSVVVVEEEQRAADAARRRAAGGARVVAEGRVGEEARERGDGRRLREGRGVSD